MGSSAARRLVFDDSVLGARARGSGDAEQQAAAGRRARVLSQSPQRDSTDEPLPRASTAIGGSTGSLGLERPAGDHLDLLVENRERFRKLEAESQVFCFVTQKSLVYASP